MTLSDLKQLAEQATPGPWCMGDSDLPVCNVAVCGGSRQHSTLARMVSPSFVNMSADEGIANARYLAALSPERILAMIRVIEAAKRMRERSPGTYNDGTVAFERTLAELEALL